MTKKKTVSNIDFLNFRVRVVSCDNDKYMAQIIMSDGNNEILLDQEGPFTTRSSVHLLSLVMMTNITRNILKALGVKRDQLKNVEKN